jgi:hypothetical protein
VESLLSSGAETTWSRLGLLSESSGSENLNAPMQRQLSNTNPLPQKWVRRAAVPLLGVDAKTSGVHRLDFTIVWENNLNV